jgi:hypothetical protein
MRLKPTSQHIQHMYERYKIHSCRSAVGMECDSYLLRQAIYFTGITV